MSLISRTFAEDVPYKQWRTGGTIVDDLKASINEGRKTQLYDIGNIREKTCLTEVTALQRSIMMPECLSFAVENP